MDNNSNASPWTKWFWGFLIALFIVIGLGTIDAKSQSLDVLNKQLFNNAVQIGNFCSGNIIHSDRDKITGEVETVVLTAKHCVVNRERMTVSTFEYDKTLRKTKSVAYEAKKMGMSYKSDLALIKLDDKQTLFNSVAKIAPEDIQLEFGQPTFIAAYPKGLSMTYTMGVLGFVEIMEGFGSMSTSTEFFRSTPDVKGGSSGAGLFTLSGGNLVLIGTTTGQWNDSTFMNYFTPIQEIREYWDVAKRALKTQGQ
jgi:S1-C subfamily serine protease